MLPKLKISLFAVLMASTLSGQLMALQEDIDAEITNYIAVFKGNDNDEERRVMDKLVWAGHSSEALYDVIAEELASVKDAKDKESKRSAFWYAKALSMSGNDKYRTLLKDVATTSKNKKAREQAEVALQRIDVYKSWNPIISAGLKEAPAGRLEETRVKNMMNAQDFLLVRIGAKRLFNAHREDQELVNVAKQRLATEWRLVDEDNDPQLDSVAWLIKAIGAAGDTSVIPLLREIKNGSNIKKVKKYATKTIKLLN